VQRHHLLLVIGAGSGLLTWEAVRQAPEGGVWALTADSTSGEALRQQAERLPALERPFILIGALSDLSSLLALREESDLRFDRILARNPLTSHQIPLAELAAGGRWLGENGRLLCVQTIPRQGQRLYALIEWSDEKLRQQVAAAEEAIYSDETDPLVNWDESNLEAAFVQAGWQHVRLYPETQIEQRRITADSLTRWFDETTEYTARPTYGQRLAQAGLTSKQIERVASLYRQQLSDQIVSWQTYLTCLIAKV
jgi:putative ATPase